MGVNVIVLAAGRGRRMYSRGPKVLADLAGRSLLRHVLDRVTGLEADCVRVVLGHGAEAVRATLPDGVDGVLQAEQRGTGDAVACALEGLDPDNVTVVLCGDVPLVQPTTHASLIAAAARSDLALLTVTVDDPAGYGRVVREADGAVARVVEEHDATVDERALSEINTGLLAMPTRALARHVAELDCDNAQSEYYLTDVIARVRDSGGRIEAVQPTFDWEVRGINNRAQLAALERVWQRHQADALLAAGVALRDPDRIDIRGTLAAGADTQIDVGCVFEGDVRLGAGVQVGAHSIVRASVIGDDSVIEPHSVIEEAVVGAGCRIGPFARLRPGNRLAEGAKVGNFVELKKADVGAGSKINHLSYVGDAAIGVGANIGAGTITCNYDGHRKHRTIIGDGAFIGSDCQLIAPVRVGEGATVGAGTTLTHDAPAGQLTIARARQRTLEGWVRPEERDESQ